MSVARLAAAILDALRCRGYTAAGAELAAQGFAIIAVLAR